MSAFSTALGHIRPRPRLSVRGLLDRIAAADRRYRQRMDMLKLDDHLLRDIGITRADVDRELRRPW